MAADVASLSVRISADTKQAEDGIDKVDRKVKGASGWKNILSGALATFTGFSAANLAGDAVGFFKDQLTDSVRQGMEANNVLAQTVAGLKSTHDASGMTAEGIENLATQIMNMTGIDDDAVQSAENMLLTFTNIGKNAFPAATKAVADLATKMAGGAVPSTEQMQQASIQLGKALNDPLHGYTALQRVGVTFTDAQKQQIQTMMQHNDIAGAQNVILQEMQREFGGSAEAAGKANGGMAIFNASMGNLKETIGQAIIPILSKLMVAILPIVQNLSEHLPGAIKAATTWFNAHMKPVLDDLWHTFTTQVLPAVKDLWNQINTQLVPALKQLWNQLAPVLIPVLKTLGHIIGEVLPPFWKMEIEVLTNVIKVISLIITWITNLVHKIGDLLGWLGNLKDHIGQFVTNALSKVGELKDKFINKLGELKDNAVKKFNELRDNVMNALAGWPGKLRDFGANLIQKIIDGIKSMGSNLSGAFGDLIRTALHNITLPGGGHIPGFASGGILPSGFAIVGEHGPELMVNPGARIYNASETANLMRPAASSGSSGSADGSGGVQHIIIQLDGRTIAESTIEHMPDIVRVGTGIKLW